MHATHHMQSKLLTVIASLSLSFACSDDTNEITEIGNSEISLDAALATISTDKIQSTVNYLAADEREGRMTGTRGYDESAQYVADQFAAMGLEPGGTDGWLQQVPFITRMLDIEDSGVTLHKNTGDVELEWKSDLIIYPDKMRAENRVEFVPRSYSPASAFTPPSWAIRITTTSTLAVRLSQCLLARLPRFHPPSALTTRLEEPRLQNWYAAAQSEKSG